MCYCDNMASSGNFLNREKFLISAQNKMSMNKNQAVPNMRIEALLEATCKRLRQERKHIKREIDREDDEIIMGGTPSKKMKLINDHQTQLL